MNRVYDWLRPWRVTDSFPMVSTSWMTRTYAKTLIRKIPASARIVINASDKRAYVEERRWRWTR